MPSGSTTTVVQSGNAPQLLPEGRAGYTQASDFYRGILTQPPMFTGQRVAPVSPAQEAYMNQSNTFFGTPQPFQTSAENQIGGTTRGDYLGGPESQAAIQSLADPIFARFRDETLPGIRDRAQFSGQGLRSTRRGVAETDALETLGRQLATSVIAPIFEGERNRQIQAAGMTGNLLNTEVNRLAQLQQGGALERSLYQEILDANRQGFEEPLFRQSQVATALAGMAGMSPGGGGGVSTSETTNQTSTGDSMMGIAQLGLMALALLRSK